MNVINLSSFLIFGFVITTALAFPYNVRNVKSEICLTEPCREVSLKMSRLLDGRAKPCDNFYDYVCGNQSYLDPMSELASRMLIRSTVLLENTIESNEPSYLTKLRQYYAACMDEERLNKSSERNFKRILNSIGGWPVLHKSNSWRDPKFQWPQIVYELRKLGYPLSYFFNIQIDVLDTDSTKRIIHINQPTLGLDRVYLVRGWNSLVVVAYFEFMMNVAKTLGAQDDVEEELRRALDFEIELARISPSQRQLQDHQKLYNVMTVRQLQAKYPDIVWLDFFNNLLAPYARIDSHEKVNVQVPRFFNKFFRLMNERKLNARDLTNRDLSNYAMWRVTLSSIDRLSERLRRLKFEFEAQLEGQEVREVQRIFICTDEMRQNMYLAMSSLYVRTFFNPRDAKHMKKVIENVRASLQQIVEQTDWIDNETRNAALEKLENMDIMMGHPEELLDDDKLNDYYEDFVVNEKSHLNTWLDFNRFFVDKYVKDFRKPLDKWDWTYLYGNSIIVNAGYMARMNAIFLPAAIMQSLIYDRNVPNYLNYGLFGYIVGHEMMHSLDLTGRLYDKQGNVADWWSPESASEYSNRSHCLANYYSNYTYGGMNVDGSNTLGENIADIGGLKAAYLAYRKLHKRHKELRLRGFEKLTPRQMFWIIFGSNYCFKGSVQFTRNAILTDEHAPNEFRVLGALTNLPEFAKDFKCSPGDPMYPDNTCAMW